MSGTDRTDKASVVVASAFTWRGFRRPLLADRFDPFDTRTDRLPFGAVLPDSLDVVILGVIKGVDSGWRIGIIPVAERAIAGSKCLKADL